MNTVVIQQLTKELRDEIRALEAICMEYDDVTENILQLNTSLNYYKDMGSIYLLYDEKKLISALTIFAPIPEEAEIYACTLPEYREKGCFMQLLNSAIEILLSHDVHQILFVCNDKSDSGTAVSKKLSDGYGFTEYSLRYNHSHDEVIINNRYSMDLHKADLKNIEDIINLSVKIFNDSYEGARNIILKTMKSDKRTQYVAVLGDKNIGIATVFIDFHGASITGLGIDPEYQGKGYGREILFLILRMLLEQGVEEIVLDVDSSNEKAFNLYKKSGFMVNSSYSYYRKTI